MLLLITKPKFTSVYMQWDYSSGVPTPSSGENMQQQALQLG